MRWQQHHPPLNAAQGRKGELRVDKNSAKSPTAKVPKRGLALGALAVSLAVFLPLANRCACLYDRLQEAGVVERA